MDQRNWPRKVVGGEVEDGDFGMVKYSAGKISDRYRGTSIMEEQVTAKNPHNSFEALGGFKQEADKDHTLELSSIYSATINANPSLVTKLS